MMTNPSSTASYGATSPSPIPPHLRPRPSRSTSASSTASSSSRRPYRQQREYVPGSIDGTFAGEAGEPGLGERWDFERALSESPGASHHHQAEGERGGDGGPAHPPPYHNSASSGEAGDHQNDDDGSDDGDDTSSEADWATAREGSIASRPWYRRPSPKWIYPFIIGATLAMGAGSAPRSEVYINLACLAHPPQAPQGMRPLDSLAENHYAQIMGVPVPLDSVSVSVSGRNVRGGADARVMHSSTTGLIGVPSGSVDEPQWSAADRWFLHLQHDIYEYNLHHSSRRNSSAPTTTPRADPSGPLPHAPTEGAPSPTPKPGDPSNGRGDGDSGQDRPAPSDPPFHEIDPRLCKKDPKVQAAAARLTMIMTLTMGILSALTTGYWGQTSDRLGRTRVMALVELAFLFNEMCFVFVATFPYLAPGGYRSLVVGPIIEGFLGGFSTFSATLNAYVSDTTPDGSRATVFARLGGFAMTGFAIGPFIGSMVIRMTGNIMIPFYVNIGVHIVLFFLILLVLPESLSTDARRILAKNAQLAADAKKRRDVLERQWENETPAPIERSDPMLTATEPRAGESGWSRRFSMNHQRSSKRQKKAWGNVKRLGRRMIAPLMPLEVFVPRKKDNGARDWNLTLTGAGLFMMSNLFGIMQVKTQYTFYAFGWTSAELGPYLSLMGFGRGSVLLLLLPFCMYLAKPYFLPTNTMPQISDSTPAPIAPSNDLGNNETSPLLHAASSTPPPPVRPKARRPAILDLYTARISLLIESSMYILLSLGLAPVPFVIVTTLVTLGSGANPAANSLALNFIPNSREAGRLFGGLAVLHALGATLLGPLMFGNLFAMTVGTYAPAVFALAAGVQAVSLILFMCVRMPNIPPGEVEAGNVERGRSRRVSGRYSARTEAGGKPSAAE